jgi:mannobiose 2-epimerase
MHRDAIPRSLSPRFLSLRSVSLCSLIPYRLSPDSRIARRLSSCALAGLVLLVLAGCEVRGVEGEATGTDEGASGGIRQALASEIDAELRSNLDMWYPRVVDSVYGGYLSNFTYDWQEMDGQEKFVVTQARHVWTLSKMAARYPDRERYAGYAAHGADFLREAMWDSTYGGFFQTVTREGHAIPSGQDETTKTLYGNAFAIYGLAALYGLAQDDDVLDLARDAFLWLDEHAYDPVHGGYFQPLAQDGTPSRPGYPKDYNSGIHILEALAELYTVWPDSLLRERLEEVFYIVRDTMVAEEGYLKLYFDAEWNHLSYRDSAEAVIRGNLNRDHITPGHDIETAFLLLESAHVLGIGDDPETHRIAKALTDHTLESGFDEEAGGVYDVSYRFPGDAVPTVVRDTKEWWGQAEALHTLAIMANLYPNDPRGYLGTLRKQWDYITTHLLDREHGGWYDHGLDTSPDSRRGRKSQIWKGNYHTVRSMAGVLDQLNEQPLR